MATLIPQRGELQTARDLGTQLFSLAQHVRDRALLLRGPPRAVGHLVLVLGELALARAHSEHGIALYDSPAAPRLWPFSMVGMTPGCAAGTLEPWRCGCLAIRTRP